MPRCGRRVISMAVLQEERRLAVKYICFLPGQSFRAAERVPRLSVDLPGGVSASWAGRWRAARWTPPRRGLAAACRWCQCLAWWELSKETSYLRKNFFWEARLSTFFRCRKPVAEQHKSDNPEWVDINGTPIAPLPVGLGLELRGPEAGSSYLREGDKLLRDEPGHAKVAHLEGHLADVPGRPFLEWRQVQVQLDKHVCRLEVPRRRRKTSLTWQPTAALLWVGTCARYLGCAWTQWLQQSSSECGKHPRGWMTSSPFWDSADFGGTAPWQWWVDHYDHCSSTPAPAQGLGAPCTCPGCFSLCWISWWCCAWCVPHVPYEWILIFPLKGYKIM